DPTAGDPDPDNTVRLVPSEVSLSAGGTFEVPAVSAMIQVTVSPKADGRVILRIDNVSTDSTLVTSKGSRGGDPSPLVWALHTPAGPFFAPGQPDRGLGLEYPSEAGRFLPLSESMNELTGAATGISPGVWVLHSSGEPLYSEGLADRGQGIERIAESG